MHTLGKLGLFAALTIPSTGFAMEKALQGVALGTTDVVEQSSLRRIVEYVRTEINRPESRKLVNAARRVKHIQDALLEANNTKNSLPKVSNTVKAVRRLKHITVAFLEVQPDTRKSRERKRAKLLQ